ncbi:unnamed protein product, partial [Ectocarpus fasciculatus]
KTIEPRTYPVDHKEIEITIDRITRAGVGYGEHEGRAVLVPFVLPGETVVAKLYSSNSEIFNAELVKVITPSPIRIGPVCHFFGQCAGCQYQHMPIETQRSIKSEHMQQVFQEIGLFSDIAAITMPMIGTDDIYAYRTKITPGYYLKSDGSQVVGFDRVGRRTVMDVDVCAIATPEVNSMYQKVRERKIERKRHNKGSIIIRESAGSAAATDYQTTISQKVGNFTYWFKSGSFFQVNKYAVPVMVRYVLQQAVGHGCTQLVDTYCGAGLFAIAAAEHFERVVAVELDKDSVTWAIENSSANNVHNVSFLASDSANIFGNVNKDDGEKSVVIVDPPRVGCSEAFLENLFEFRPRKIVYVSCDPSTQARDARIIVNNGYKLTELTPVDLFPQTKHIESVATFVLEDSSS